MMTNINKRTVLVVAAHPDDEVLGCGGVISRHMTQGDSVHIMILGEGIASRAGLPPDTVRKQLEELQASIRSAHAVLGTGEATVRQLPDNQFDTVSLLSVVHEIEKVIEQKQPDLVYTHHAGDVNIDHRVVSQAVEAATRLMDGSPVNEVRAFEVPSSSEWNFTREPFRPNLFVALTEPQLKQKIDAMRAYESEIREYPHPRSPEYLEALARVRGGQSGTHAAEAFALVFNREL